MAPAPLTPAEAAFYPTLFSKFQENGTINGGAAFGLLTLSDVPQAQLGEIWSYADVNDTGLLDVAGWTLAMRLIAVAQRGGEISHEAGERPATQLPTFRGYPPPAPSAIRPQATGSFSHTGTVLDPPLTPEDLAKFKRHFALAGPVGGRLSSDKATAIFLKSKLPSPQLGAIWNLADTQNRGALDQADFIIGMYFIQAVMSGKITNLPQTLPAGLYEMASEGRSLPGSNLRSLSVSPAPISRQTTGQQPLAPVPRQMTGQQLQTPVSPVSRNATGGQYGSAFQQQQPVLSNVTGGSHHSPANRQSGFASAQPQAQVSTVPWDVSAQEKAASDRFFDQLDKFGRGVLDGDVAVPFMLESKLPETVLASIWDLADIRKEGNLTRDEFAVAMYLIRSKISGKELPATLPTSLVPPSLRKPEISAPQKDLFDAFSESPPAVATAASSYFTSASNPAQAPVASQSAFGAGSQNFGSAPFGGSNNIEDDLFGDDTFAPVPAVKSLPSAIPTPMASRSAPQSARSPPPPPPELSRLRTESNTLAGSVSELQSSGLALEQQTVDHAKEIMDLQAKLVGLRATHESENGNVVKLRAKASEQATELNTLKSDLIRAESELSGLRSEKTDLDGQIMRDKEDIREMKRRMAEVAEETTKLKAQVEKVKRDARQQKGLVTITKKQLGTAEGEREKTTAALADAEKGVGLEVERSASPFGAAFAPSAIPAGLQTASQIPLPQTPDRILSPALSVTSQKSNNPFDRFVPSPASSPAVASPPSQPVKDLADSSSPITTSPVSHVAELAVGGVAAAGAALAGVGAAIFGAGKDSDKTEEKEEEEAALESKADDFGGFDDSFGTVSTGAVPAAAPSAEQGGAAKAFDQGFGDSFDDGFATSHPAPAAAAQLPVDSEVGTPSETPFTNSGFETSFGGEFKPAVAEEKNVEQPTDVTIDQVHNPEFEVPLAVAVPLQEPEHATESTSAPVPAAIDEAPPAVRPPSLEPAAAAAPVPAPVAVEDEDSSDDEEEGPEDLDAPKSALSMSRGSISPASAEPSTSNPVPVSGEDKTLTANVFGSDNFGSPSGHERFITAPPSASFPSPESTASNQRRAAPPPPPARNSAAVPAVPAMAAAGAATVAAPFTASPTEGFDTSFNPFGGFDSKTETSPFDSTTTDSARRDTGFGQQASPIVAPPSDAFDVPSTSTTTKAPAVASFDDDFDTDFDDVGTAPAAMVAAPTAPTPAIAAPKAASSPIGGFEDDADFEDFSTDFDPVPQDVPTSSVAAVPTVAASLPTTLPAPGQGHYTVDPSFADFDSAFGNARSIQQQQGARPAVNTQFSFDDAFGETPASGATSAAAAPLTASFDDAFGLPAATPLPAAGSLEAPAAAGETINRSPSPLYDVPAGPAPPPEIHYNPPSGSPPSAGRPALPTRKTAAEADDIPDVKTIVGMGFSRSQALTALEISNYNLDAAIEHLVGGGA